MRAFVVINYENRTRIGQETFTYTFENREELIHKIGVESKILSNQGFYIRKISITE